ncbi:leucine-rich repeat-containing protein 2 isoform X3 [Mesocricetus auratus]|uniref:Leucine-rich repeat-containing protein 2 isoform X3 n=1 Tax=Mesocricetus auratus TaxID=10036 RepID=A0ABM2X630_MESAU|nr:leucine-rich repeat-containing protein 2 isoform X3 [Mesocricetus auratus]
MWQQNFAAEGDVYRSRQPMHSCVVSSRPDWTIGDSATKTQTKRRWRLQIDLRRIKEEWDFVAECRRKGVPQAQYCKNGFVDTNTRLLDKIERNSVARQRSRVKDRDKRSNPFVFELSGAQWKELPDSLKEQTHLKEWHIHSTRIQTIPAYIKLFQAMKILDLPKNQITCLPAEIGRLKNLKELNVSFNHLRSIPPELGDCENLERLDCSGNLDLMELPFELSNLKQVTFVDISANKFSSVPICVLRMCRLQWLDISNNNLSDLPQDIDRFISLMDNPIDKTQCQDMDETIESEQDRQHFDKEFMKAYIEDLREREAVPSYTTKVSFSLQL